MRLPLFGIQNHIECSMNIKKKETLREGMMAEKGIHGQGRMKMGLKETQISEFSNSKHFTNW